MADNNNESLIDEIKGLATCGRNYSATGTAGWVYLDRILRAIERNASEQLDGLDANEYCEDCETAKIHGLWNFCPECGNNLRKSS